MLNASGSTGNRANSFFFSIRFRSVRTLILRIWPSGACRVNDSMCMSSFCPKKAMLMGLPSSG